MSSVVDELYSRLNKIADQLSEELCRPVSVREAILRLVESMKLEPSDLAWSWRMNEAAEKEQSRDQAALVK